MNLTRIIKFAKEFSDKQIVVTLSQQLLWSHILALLPIKAIDAKFYYVQDAAALQKLNYYSRFDEIKGGIWEMDPDRYEAGKGKIYWSNNKPFMSVRLSFWHPSNNPSGVSDAWIDGYANAVDSYSTDPAAQDGYTILNFHPWTVNIANLERLVSKLDSHVQIVSAPEIVKLASDNVIR
jgi:hypothetical protein